MKVKDLIKMLTAFEMDLEIEIHTDHGWAKITDIEVISNGDLKYFSEYLKIEVDTNPS